MIELSVKCLFRYFSFPKVCGGGGEWGWGVKGGKDNNISNSHLLSNS
jgi:hypothetical protein